MREKERHESECLVWRIMYPIEGISRTLPTKQSREVQGAISTAKSTARKLWEELFLFTTTDISVIRKEQTGKSCDIFYNFGGWHQTAGVPG